MKNSGKFHRWMWRIVPRPPVHFTMSLHGQEHAMTFYSQFPSAESILDAAPVASRGAGRLSFWARISSMAKGISDYIETAADYYAAAAIYEQLSRLSDAELHRRGLSRASLARDVCATLDAAGLSA
jgi:hypothetical protein